MWWPGCIFCGKKILPWQKVRAAQPDANGHRVAAHVSCYNRRLKAGR